jgi:hypothetical protein
MRRNTQDKRSLRSYIQLVLKEHTARAAQTRENAEP